MMLAWLGVNVASYAQTYGDLDYTRYTAIRIFGVITLGIIRESWANPRPLSLGNLLTTISLIVGTGLLLGAYIGNPDPVCHGKIMAKLH